MKLFGIRGTKKDTFSLFIYDIRQAGDSHFM